MKIMYTLAFVLSASCGGSVDSIDGIDETDVGVIVHENAVCEDLIPRLCRTCGQTCEMCGSYEGQAICDVCVEEARNAGECVELIDACW